MLTKKYSRGLPDIRESTKFVWPALKLIYSLKHSTVQCSAVQCSAVQYSTVQYNKVQYSIVQYNTIKYSTV